MNAHSTRQRVKPAAAAEIEAIFNRIHASGLPLGTVPLTGTCQYTITGVGSWRVTLKEGVSTCVRCDARCAPPPDATITCSPDVFVRVLHRESHLDAEAAMYQGLITITGDRALALAVVYGAS